MRRVAWFVLFLSLDAVCLVVELPRRLRWAVQDAAHWLRETWRSAGE